MAMEGSAPIFAMTNLEQPPVSALCFYILLGGMMGLIGVGVTRAVYFIEDGFEKLPIHWMWWPALGGLAVGGVGFFAPKTMGVGYDNIEHVLSGSLTGQALLALFVLKFLSWVIALGSGTSGGTLAPLFTIGGGLGVLLGAAAQAIAPNPGIDLPRNPSPPTPASICTSPLSSAWPPSSPARPAPSSPPWSSPSKPPSSRWA